MLDLFIAEGTKVAGMVRPDDLLHPVNGSLTLALKLAVTKATQPIGYLGYVLMIVGLVQSLIRQNDSPREQLHVITRVVVLALLLSLFRLDTSWREFVPNASAALAEAMGSPGEAVIKAMGNFVELLYPGGDIKSTAAIKGASNTWFFNVVGRAAETAMNMITGLVGLLVMLLCFVSVFIGWIVGLVVVWLSQTFYIFGLLLLPAALGALAVDSLRGVGQTYLLGLVSVGTGKFALALGHVGSKALLEWVVSLVNTLTRAQLDPLLLSLNDVQRKAFVNGVALLPPGGWGLLFLAILILSLWTIVAPIFAWKVFMTTLRTGAQFGSRLGFAFAGATLRAAGNAAELGATKLKSAAQGGGGNGRGAARSGGRQVAGGGTAAGDGDNGESGGSASDGRPMQAGGSHERSQASESARLTGTKLAQARARVGEAAFRAHLSECAEPQTRAICEKVARESGAPPSQAQELAAEVCGATPARRPAEPAAQEAPAETPRPELARLANHLGVAAAVLRRASAHASEGLPEPTDNGVLAAVQRTLPRPEKAEKPS